MIHDLEICAACGAGDTCADCFGSGAEPDGPAGSCITCGATGEEPRLLPSCSEQRCGVSLPGPES